MNELAIRLKCTRCEAFTEFVQTGPETVKCIDCGKKHNTDSLHAVEP